ncbi:MAG: tRNA (adenosine(37)-N6)-dimethylallyltransferase MiaA [Synergistales bacterium]|nr:tRNA (adenosine(37)-N6)-dimethylallyltransferase MiaA [Synergistales bacterium]
MPGERIVVPALIGPTASGKTSLSLRIARELNAEVISVDSRQVYRYMDVGTDKVDRQTRYEILHHLIDVADPDEVYSAADFVRQATDAVRRIRARGRLPLLVGGTPFYFSALAEGLLSGDLPKDEQLRRELEAEAERNGRAALHARLQKADPGAAATIHPNDTTRVVRALEITLLSGKPVTEVYGEQERMESPVEPRYIGLAPDRGGLYGIIAQRVRAQFAAGYVEEVAWLLQKGFARDLPAMKGFGYREIAAHLQGECTLEEAIQGDIRSTKAFSRRQMTWFRKFPGVVWYDAGSACADEAVFDEICGLCLANAGEERD